MQHGPNTPDTRVDPSDVDPSDDVPVFDRATASSSLRQDNTLPSARRPAPDPPSSDQTP